MAVLGVAFGFLGLVIGVAMPIIMWVLDDLSSERRARKKASEPEPPVEIVRHKGLFGEKWRWD